MDTDPDEKHSEYFEANREHWEEMVQPVSLTDSTDAIDEFVAGETALWPIEQEELGSVDGKTLLELQSSIGLRTLSWARKGATVTGVDISAESIDLAREFAVETGLENRSTFIRANIYDLPDIHAERYDVVFSYMGVLCWLPDIERWAEVVAEFLEPGGTFYLAEYHPIADALSYVLGSDEDPTNVEYSYFSTETPATAESPYKWAHSLGETLSALIDADIELRFIHEHSVSPIELFPERGMVEDEYGYWRFENDIGLPLMVTVNGEMKEK